MTKDFRSYLLQHERTHFYRVKTITPIGDFGATEEERVDASLLLTRIENAVAKYDPVHIERVKKTILQRFPLDFVNVSNKEVYILDMEFGLRVSPTELQHLITVILNVPENYVMVYGESDPREVGDQVTAMVKEMDEEAEKHDMQPADILTNTDHTEVDQNIDVKYGDAYNARLLAYFNKNRSHADEEKNNFNSDVSGALSAHPDVEPGEEFTVRNVRRTYRDAKGNLHTLVRKLDRFGSVEDYD